MLISNNNKLVSMAEQWTELVADYWLMQLKYCRQLT